MVIHQVREHEGSKDLFHGNGSFRDVRVLEHGFQRTKLSKAARPDAARRDREDAKQEWLDSGMKKIESLWGGQAGCGQGWSPNEF